MRDRGAILRRDRISDGCCGRCGRPRGKDGTSTMCRGCADHVAGTHIRAKEARKHAPPKRNECENCFRPFQPQQRGSGLFCEACEPWFPNLHCGDLAPVDHEAEQVQARKAVPTRECPLTAESIIDQWAKEA